MTFISLERLSFSRSPSPASAETGVLVCNYVKSPRRMLSWAVFTKVYLEMYSYISENQTMERSGFIRGTLIETLSKTETRCKDIQNKMTGLKSFKVRTSC